MAKKSGKKMDPNVLIAIIGGAVTIIAALLGSPLLIELINKGDATPTPEVVVTEEIQPPTPVPPPGDPVLVFSEDFEDGRADGFATLEGSWQVRKTGGNSYYEGSGRAETLFGSLANGTVSFQARFAQNDNAALRFRHSVAARYQLTFDAGADLVRLSYLGGGAPETLGESPFVFERNTWYALRLDLDGAELRVYVNDVLLLTVSDGRLAQGELHFFVDSGQSVTLDNLAVWSAGN